MTSGFLVSAPSSGSGKTTVARGLMALLTAKGMRVQPFKCGPDYIDTKFHEAMCSRPSINLDTFMSTPEHVRELFLRYGKDSVCIVEGMMGLFDGYDRDRGSSAEIASVLGIPVVLVVDARSAAYSMAPLLQGFMNFRSDVNIAGVIYNKVGSERHYQMLKQVCDDLHLRCFGYLPKCARLEQGSRYLGLDFTEQMETAVLLRLMEAHVDWEGLSRLGEHPRQTAAPAAEDFTIHNSQFIIHNSQCAAEDCAAGGKKPSVCIARNAESFSFLYQEVIDGFDRPRFFDPETEVPDLRGVDLLYLPGGYPEKHLEALAANEAARRAIREYAERGGRVVAECGGMMYLCDRIVTDDGQHPMCGVLPYTISARRADRRLSLGYRRFVLNGQECRGHEFHYTQFLGDLPKSATQVYNAKGEPVDTPVFIHNNVLASYTHLYHLPFTKFTIFNLQSSIFHFPFTI